MQAVIFDMDGVLCATVEFHYLSWKRLSAEYGIPFTHQDNEKLLGLTRRSSLEVILGERQLPEETLQEMLELKNVYYLEYVDQMTSEDLLPGVTALLEEIKAEGLKVGIASASSNTAPVLEKLGIGEKVDVVVDGNTVSRSKPYPDVFLEAASALGLLPEECLVLEDSSAGVEAACAAGMCVVGLGPSERVSGAEAVFQSLESVHLHDLKEIYARWRSLRR